MASYLSSLFPCVREGVNIVQVHKGIYVIVILLINDWLLNFLRNLLANKVIFKPVYSIGYPSSQECRSYDLGISGVPGSRNPVQDVLPGGDFQSSFGFGCWHSPPLDPLVLKVGFERSVDANVQWLGDASASSRDEL